MSKHFFLFILFLMLAGGICAVGSKKVAATPCGVKKANSSVKNKQLHADPLKGKNWILSVMFRQ